MHYGVNVQTNFGSETANAFVKNLDPCASLRVFPSWAAAGFGRHWNTIYEHFPPSKFPYDYEVCLNQYTLNQLYGPRWTLENFIEMVNYFVGQYPMSQISAVEIFNEVQFSKKWTGYLAANGARGYRDMLAAAYPIIKRANPSCLVVAFGGLSCFEKGLISLYNRGDFASGSPSYQILKDVWDLGAANYCDAISCHCYAFHTTPPTDVTFYTDLDDHPWMGNGLTCKYTVSQCMAKKAQLYHDLARKPVYYDEVGVSVTSLDDRGNPITPEVQGRYLAQAFNLLRTLPGCVAIKWWNLAGQAPDGDFGLFDGEGNSRPAYDSLLAFLRQSS